MNNATDPIKRLKGIKVIANLVVICGFALGAMVSCVIYIDWSAERKARAFCDEIAVGSDISTAIEKSKSENILHGPHEGSYKGYTFYFPGVVFSKAGCEVAVNQDGKVTAKGSSMERG